MFLIRWTSFMLCCAHVLQFGEHTLCYVACFCCTSVNTLHVTLHTYVVLRWPNSTLRCVLLLFFGKHTSCYAARFCWLLWTHFMLRCACVLYFGEHTSCNVVRVCFNSLNTLHVLCCALLRTSVNALRFSLRAYVVLRWTHFMLHCARMF